MTDDLRGRLEDMSSEELVRILEERDAAEWRPEVFPLIESILAARGVALPAPLPPAEPDAGPEPSLESVATLSGALEANLCRMALTEAGIEAWLSTENLAGVAPHLGLAIGVDVLVRREDAAAAREVLEAGRSGAIALPVDPEPCPRCGSTGTEHYRRTDPLSAGSGWFLTAYPMPTGDWRWRCSSCGHEWR
jgi:hypothetical protein